MPASVLNSSPGRQHPTENQLMVYLAGGGSEAFRSAIEKHLTLCKSCVGFVSSSSHPPEVGLPPDAASIAWTEESLPVQLTNHPQYRMERELGRGGMGIVYLVQHRLTGRLEALKVLMPALTERPDMRARFLREIQAAAQLDHPNICRALNAFEEGPLLGLVMEYLPGVDLAAFVSQKGHLPFEVACNLAVQLCQGLDHAYKKGMIHRDIKPANLIIQKVGESLQLKILDFGLAKGASELSHSDEKLTREGRVLGTPEYMSPEQAMNPSQADIRSDLYSVGCTLYFMLSGKPPFEGETIYSVINAHLTKTAIPLPQQNPQVPEVLWKVVQSLLDKKAERRPQTPEQAAYLLKHCLAPSTAAPVQNSMPRIPVAAPAGKMTPPKSAAQSISRRRKQSGIPITRFLSLILPPLLAIATVAYFNDTIVSRLSAIWRSPNGTIVLEKLPSDFDVWIDDRPTTFSRPTANSSAQVLAEPGTYKLSLKHRGETLQEESITVVAGREIHLQVDVQAFANRAKPRPNIGPTLGTKPTSAAEDNHPSSTVVSTPPASSTTKTAVSEDVVNQAIVSATQAIKERNGTKALTSLLTVYVSANDHLISSDHPQFLRVANLHQLASALTKFTVAIDSSLTKRIAGESMFVGAHQIAIIEATPERLSIRHQGANVDFERTELPSNIEQTLVDLELDLSVPQNQLVKAAGLLTHPKLSVRGSELVRTWLSESISAKVIKEDFLQFAESIAHTAAPENTAVITPLEISADNAAADFNPSHSFSRRLQGAIGAIDSLYFLPPNVPFPKLTMVMGSSSNFHGYGQSLVNFWDVDSGTKAQRDSITGPIWACDSSSNGRIFITFGYTSPQTNLRVYALPSANPIYQMSDFADERSAIVLSPDGRTLAGCGTEEVFIRWNLQAKSEVTRMVAKKPIGKENVAAIALRDSMDMVAVAAKDGSIRVWHTSDGRELAVLSQPREVTSAVKLLRFSRGGKNLSTTFHSGMTELYDLSKWGLANSFRAHSAPIVAARASANSKFFVTADLQRNIRIWDANDLSLVGGFRDDLNSKIATVSVNDAADFVAIGFEDSSINLWKKK